MSARTSRKKGKAAPEPTPRSPKAEAHVPGLPYMRIYRFIRGNMSQEELGDLVGVTQGQISQWESGESDVPLGRVHELADALNTTAHALQFVHPLSPEADVANAWKDVPESLRPVALNVLKNFKQ